MNIPKFNIPQKIVLFLGLLYIAVYCLTYQSYGHYLVPDLLGIIIVTGLLVYLVGIVSQNKRRLKITAIVLGITILLFIGLVMIFSLLKQEESKSLYISPEREAWLKEARKRGLITQEEYEERLRQERVNERRLKDLLEELERRGKLSEEDRPRLQELRRKYNDK